MDSLRYVVHVRSEIEVLQQQINNNRHNQHELLGKKTWKITQKQIHSHLVDTADFHCAF